MTRLPTSRIDPSGQARIEEASAKQSVRLYNAYLMAIANAAIRGDDMDMAGAKELAALQTVSLGWVDKSHAQALIKTQKVLDNLKVGIQLGPIGLPQDQLDALYRTVVTDVQSLAEESKVKVANILTDAMNAGLGAKQMSKLIMSETNGDRNRADVIARTTVMKTNNDVAINRYTRAGAVGFFAMPTPDDRLCPHCREYAYVNGTRQLRFYKSVSLPVHPRCRCAAVPAFSEDEIYTM